jgi:hypothetical protein
MARALRLEFKGALYHVCARGKRAEEDKKLKCTFEMLNV